MSHKYGAESRVFKSTNIIVGARGLGNKLRGKFPPKFTFSGVFLPDSAGWRGHTCLGVGKAVRSKSKRMIGRLSRKKSISLMLARHARHEKKNRFMGFLRGPE